MMPEALELKFRKLALRLATTDGASTPPGDCWRPVIGGPLDISVEQILNILSC